ncbi:hypothetical protein F5Y03DRAFT_390358 [Xylaria venustula]|nr:hypothetical protein F5Y03DRAFT_390358 [Xylaria venustula]
MDYEYDFWQCGHITATKDGSIVSSNGSLTPVNAHRSSIKRRPNDLCALCHCDQLMVRLKDIRELASCCMFLGDPMRTCLRKLASLKNFMPDRPEGRFVSANTKFEDYPAEFRSIEHHTLQLELEVTEAAMNEYVEARKRLRANVAQTFIDRLHQIEASALLWSEYDVCTDNVRGCLSRILNETRDLILEIQRDQIAGLRQFAQLDVETANLRRVLNKYDPKIEERFEVALGRPGS